METDSQNTEKNLKEIASLKSQLGSMEAEIEKKGILIASLTSQKQESEKERAQLSQEIKKIRQIAYGHK